MAIRVCKCQLIFCFVFFFNDTATTDIYTLSLHDALPICRGPRRSPRNDTGPPGAAVGRSRRGSLTPDGLVTKGPPARAALLTGCRYSAGVGRKPGPACGSFSPLGRR